MAITKNILVTGAGSGIGRAIAQHLSKNNYDLVLLGRNSDHLEETRNSLECPEKHQCISCDIRLSKDIAKALEKSKINSLYALVANAGIGGENSYLSNDRWHEIIDTNLTGPTTPFKKVFLILKRIRLHLKKSLSSLQFWLGWEYQDILPIALQKQDF